MKTNCELCWDSWAMWGQFMWAMKAINFGAFNYWFWEFRLLRSYVGGSYCTESVGASHMWEGQITCKVFMRRESSIGVGATDIVRWGQKSKIRQGCKSPLPSVFQVKPILRSYLRTCSWLIDNRGKKVHERVVSGIWLWPFSWGALTGGDSF